tara:strand:+ start:59 stop:559 length:501 start_codon:yes stop_codon:yes gene_type:complete
MKKFFLPLLIFFNLIGNAFAIEKIVYLDLDYILSNSNKGKNILSDLDKKNNENIKILKSKEEILKIEEENLLKQKNIISNEAYNEKVKNLQNKVKIFRSEKNQLVTEFKKNRENKINEFIKIVDNILGEYVKANSIDLVLNKKDIVMGKNSFNITEEILKKVNELK